MRKNYKLMDIFTNWLTLLVLKGQQYMSVLGQLCGFIRTCDSALLGEVYAFYFPRTEDSVLPSGSGTTQASTTTPTY